MNYIYIVFGIFNRRYAFGLAFTKYSMQKFLHFKKNALVFFHLKSILGGWGGIGFLSGQNSAVVKASGANK